MNDFIDSRRSDRPHSVLGVFSFLVALLASLPGFPCVILFAIMVATSSQDEYPEWLSTSMGFAALASAASLCLIPLSLLLGLLSLFERERRYTFGLIGLAQSIMLLCPFITLGLLFLVIWQE
jgi:hypothetical protein